MIHFLTRGIHNGKLARKDRETLLDTSEQSSLSIVGHIVHVDLGEKERKGTFNMQYFLLGILEHDVHGEGPICPETPSTKEVALLHGNQFESILHRHGVLVRCLESSDHLKHLHLLFH